MRKDIVYNEDCLTGLAKMPDESVDCCVTSPPYYGLRDYGHGDQLGLETTPDLYVDKMVQVFEQVKRVLKKEGTLWLNLGDTYNAYKANTWDTNYAGHSQRPVHKKGLTTTNLKNKDLIGIPWMMAFALRSAGWYLRQDIIWHKPNPMPESVTDRCTKAHEYIFLLSKSAKYYYDAESIKSVMADTTVQRLLQGGLGLQKGSDRVPGKTNGAMKAVGTLRKGYSHRGTGDKKMSGHSGNRDADGNIIGDGFANKRSVWTVTTKPYSEAHFATFPQDLIVDCIKAGCPEYVCNKCGKARERNFDVKPMVINRSNRREEMGQPDGIAASGNVVSNREAIFKGYTDCGCNEGFSHGVVLDPFMGAFTTALVAKKLNRHFVGFELNADYIKIGEKRLNVELGMFR